MSNEVSDLWYRKMLNLEKELKETALNLFEHMGSANSCKIPIPNTSPQVFIVVGDESGIKRLTKEFKESQ